MYKAFYNSGAFSEKLLTEALFLSSIFGMIRQKISENPKKKLRIEFLETGFLQFLTTKSQN